MKKKHNWEYTQGDLTAVIPYYRIDAGGDCIALVYGTNSSARERRAKLICEAVNERDDIKRKAKAEFAEGLIEMLDLRVVSLEKRMRLESPEVREMLQATVIKELGNLRKVLAEAARPEGKRIQNKKRKK